MWMKDNHIDHGMAFDWGRTSLDYAKYRDIYPDQFYEKILDRDLCRKGQTVLDIGTGTGVIPRNLYRYGAKWIGTDISENQIEQAKILSQGMDIEYDAIPAESISFQDNSFDVITACQCFWYFKHEIAAPVFWKVLKPNGRMLILYNGPPVKTTLSEFIVNQIFPILTLAASRATPFVQAAVSRLRQQVANDILTLYITKNIW